MKHGQHLTTPFKQEQPIKYVLIIILINYWLKNSFLLSANSIKTLTQLVSEFTKNHLITLKCEYIFFVWDF